MVSAADALVAWETYPHRDAFETGSRGARLLDDIIDGKLRPADGDGQGARAGRAAYTAIPKGLVRLPTSCGSPRRSKVTMAWSRPAPSWFIPTSICRKWAAAAWSLPTATWIAPPHWPAEIAQRFWQRRFDLDPVVFTPAEAIERGRQIEGGPVLLVETADCCGGGAAGDSVATLRALLDAKLTEPALVPVVDPAAAAICHRAKVGSRLTLDLGHHLDPRWGRSINVTGEVLHLGDGRFRYTGGIWDGQLGEMGPSAVLAIGPVRVLITTHATYDWADEQFRAVGLDPRSAKFVVVKNPMNYRLGYAGVSRAAFILDTPGPTPAVLRNVRYRHLRRPYYPADREIVGLEPVVFRGRV